MKPSTAAHTPGAVLPAVPGDFRILRSMWQIVKKL